MRIALVTDILSPHQMPLARELARRLGEGNFRYVALEPPQTDRSRLGWAVGSVPGWVLKKGDSAQRDVEIEQWRAEADVVLTGYRTVELFASRAQRKLLNLYMSERWFKPPLGLIRLLQPEYLHRSWQLLRLLHKGDVTYLAIGTHSVVDVVIARRVLSGGVAGLSQRLALPVRPSSDSAAGSGVASRRLGSAASAGVGRMWGYFVDPSHAPATADGGAVSACGDDPYAGARPAAPVRVLWVGRMVGWKRVDTLLEAMALVAGRGVKVELKVFGYGPEESSLRRLAGRRLRPEAVTFHPAVPISQVRGLMQDADVYVLPSSGYEGWGVVVNEAMLEGCAVVASRESGAGATLIRDGENGLLFRSGDVRALAQALERLATDAAWRLRLARAGQASMLAEWTPAVAAERMLAFSESLLAGRPPPEWEGGPLSRV